jgi:hypothetical protein
MPELPLFVLVAITEDALIGTWTFRAADELDVVGHLLRDPWSYERIFRGLRISLRTIDQVSSERLLQAINDSYANVHCDAVVYLVRVPPESICEVQRTDGPTRRNVPLTQGGP